MSMSQFANKNLRIIYAKNDNSFNCFDVCYKFFFIGLFLEAEKQLIIKRN